MARSVSLYFTDDRDQRWRVYDIAFGPPLTALHQRKILALGDLRARYRVFVPADRTAPLRVHDFRRSGSDRELSADVLASQLRAAGFTPRARYVPATSSPGTNLGC